MHIIFSFIGIIYNLRPCAAHVPSSEKFLRYTNHYWFFEFWYSTCTLVSALVLIQITISGAVFVQKGYPLSQLQVLNLFCNYMFPQNCAFFFGLNLYSIFFLFHWSENWWNYLSSRYRTSMYVQVKYVYYRFGLPYGTVRYGTGL